MNNRYLLNAAGENAEQWWTNKLKSVFFKDDKYGELETYGYSLLRGGYVEPYKIDNLIDLYTFYFRIDPKKSEMVECSIQIDFTSAEKHHEFYFSISNQKALTIKLLQSNDPRWYFIMSAKITNSKMGSQFKNYIFSSINQAMPIYLSATPPHGDSPAKSMRQCHFDPRGGVNVQSGITVGKQYLQRYRKWNLYCHSFDRKSPWGNYDCVALHKFLQVGNKIVYLGFLCWGHGSIVFPDWFKTTNQSPVGIQSDSRANAKNNYRTVYRSRNLPLPTNCLASNTSYFMEVA